MLGIRLHLFIAIFIILSISSAWAQWTPVTPITSVTRDVEGATAVFRSGAVLKLQVCSDSIIHVLYSPTGNFPNHGRLIHPTQGVAGFNDENLKQLSQAFTNKTGL